MKIHRGFFRLGTACFRYGVVVKWRGSYRAFGPRERGLGESWEARNIELHQSRDTLVVDAIAETLRSTDAWSPDTLDEIAMLVTAVGHRSITEDEMSAIRESNVARMTIALDPRD